MNGSNHFEESDAKPLRLCPVCLRKLQFACKFDVVSRYEALESFCRDNEMTPEATWFTARLEQIRP
jgi:archaemetzincin